MTAVLEFDQVRARYGYARILDGVSLQVNEGETLALVGRNGAGKTTTLHTIFGIPTMDEGEIRVRGEALRVRKTFEAAKHGVAIAPQGRRILSNLTIEENLLLGGASDREGPWDLEGIYELFPILRDRRRLSGTSLSGGEQQMLCIGRALMSNPSVLLLDEPSEGLAPVLVDQVAETLLELKRQGVALLLVEQHLTLVRRVSDRYAVLVKGQVAAEGDMADMDVEALQSILAV